MTDGPVWTAPQWQAYLEKIEPFSERKRILENEVPEEMRARVKNHLQTVRAIRNFYRNKQK